MTRIKTGDKVKIMPGSLKGKVAEVERLDGSRVYLRGIRQVERHYRATAYNQGGKRDVHLPIDISNVALLVDDKPTKVAYLVNDTKKVRIAKLNKKEIK